MKKSFLKGSCGCQNVKYRVNDKPLFTQACHCKDCKKSTGSSFVIHTMVLEKLLLDRVAQSIQSPVVAQACSSW